MTSSVPVDLAVIKEDVSFEAVARYFGGSGYKPPEKTRERILRSLETASDLTAPQAVYRLYAIRRIIPGEGVQLDNGAELKLPLCVTDVQTRFAAAVIGTLGGGLENGCRKLAKAGELYSATLFDAIGTAMLDLLSEAICDLLQRQCKENGLTAGKRFAPGINGYPLEQQRQLFRLVDHNSIGVSLNSSAVMVPTKSVSFFLMMTGTSPDARAVHKCSECEMLHCQFRMNSRPPSMV